jgi:hypothetical protein
MLQLGQLKVTKYIRSSPWGAQTIGVVFYVHLGIMSRTVETLQPDSTGAVNEIECASIGQGLEDGRLIQEWGHRGCNLCTCILCELWHLCQLSTGPAFRTNCSFPGEQIIHEKAPRWCCCPPFVPIYTVQLFWRYWLKKKLLNIANSKVARRL